MFRLITLLIFLFPSLFAKEIVFWHAFEGFLAQKFTEIVEDFNHQSGTYQIKLVYKGNYKETFEKGVEFFGKGEAPALLQVYEVATQTMMLRPEMFRAADELMRSYFKKFDPAIYIDAVRHFYSTSEGKLYSLPWNASTGILFYNKKAFEKAGLNPEIAPKTWDEVESACLCLAKAGYVGFVTAWPAAYHLEHLSALHNLPFASYENGYGGLKARLLFNGETQLFHIQKLVQWQKEGLFSYKGRMTAEPEKFFTDGHCGMLLQGANRFPSLKQNMQDPIGVGFFPYWSHVKGAPYSLNIGGSSFWALSGFDEETYRGISHFFNYLSQPEVQAYWHQQTGYLPITEAAYYLTKKKGFYESNPSHEIAVLEVMDRKVTPYTKGVRLGNYLLIRDKIVDHLEKAFSGELTPKQALDGAVAQGNTMLEAFEKQHLKTADPQ